MENQENQKKEYKTSTLTFFVFLAASFFVGTLISGVYYQNVANDIIYENAWKCKEVCNVCGVSDNLTYNIPELGGFGDVIDTMTPKETRTMPKIP